MCSHAIAALKSAERWTLVNQVVFSCDILPLPVWPPIRAMLSGSTLAYSSALNTSLFVPRLFVHIFYSISLHSTLPPVLRLSRRNLSIQKYCSSEMPLYHLDSQAALSLSLAKTVMVVGNCTGSNQSMYSVPDVVLMSVPAAIALASLCPIPSRLTPLGLIHASSSSDYSPGSACSFHSRSVMDRMSLNV